MKIKASILFLSLLIGAGSASAATITVTVNQFESNPGWEAEVADTWYHSTSWQTSSGGTTTIENGAARLTTPNDANAIANVSTWANFGKASAVLNSIDLSYDFYKAAGPFPAAAPALKLTIWTPGYTDSGTLIYEPYWNGPVPTDAWTTVAIDENTGSGSDATGGWWWTGGGWNGEFGIPNSFGGPPLRSLAEWAAAFAADPDWANAEVRGLSVGIGGGNPSEDNYFDIVSIKTGNIDKTYNFELDLDGDGFPDDVDECPDSDLSPTVVIDGRNSGVPNTLFANGCTISDLIAHCAAGASNHGQFVSCVAHLTADLKKQGVITGKQKGAIDKYAGKSSIGK